MVNVCKLSQNSVYGVKGTELLVVKSLNSVIKTKINYLKEISVTIRIQGKRLRKSL